MEEDKEISIIDLTSKQYEPGPVLKERTPNLNRNFADDPDGAAGKKVTKEVRRRRLSKKGLLHLSPENIGNPIGNVGAFSDTKNDSGEVGWFGAEEDLGGEDKHPINNSDDNDDNLDKDMENKKMSFETKELFKLAKALRSVGQHSASDSIFKIVLTASNSDEPNDREAVKAVIAPYVSRAMSSLWSKNMLNGQPARRKTKAEVENVYHQLALYFVQTRWTGTYPTKADQTRMGTFLKQSNFRKIDIDDLQLMMFNEGDSAYATWDTWMPGDESKFTLESFKNKVDVKRDLQKFIVAWNSVTEYYSKHLASKPAPDSAPTTAPTAGKSENKSPEAGGGGVAKQPESSEPTVKQVQKKINELWNSNDKYKELLSSNPDLKLPLAEDGGIGDQTNGALRALIGRDFGNTSTTDAMRLLNKKETQGAADTASPTATTPAASTPAEPAAATSTEPAAESRPVAMSAGANDDWIFVPSDNREERVAISRKNNSIYLAGPDGAALPLNRSLSRSEKRRLNKQIGISEGDRAKRRLYSNLINRESRAGKTKERIRGDTPNRGVRRRRG